MRFLQRHVYRTVFDHLKLRLDDLGWVSEPVNFGEPPLVFVDDERVEGRAEPVAGNSVSLMVDQQNSDRLAELGGPLRSVEIAFAADVYGTRPSVAVSIGSDIIDVVREKTLRVVDYTPSTPVQSPFVVELDDPMMSRPLGDVNALEFKQAWRVVRFYGLVSYSG